MSDIINEIREQWRRRQSWHRAEKSLTLQAKAMCRRLVAMAGDTEAERKKQISAADALYERAVTGDDSADAQTAMAAMLPLLEAHTVMKAHRKAVEKRLVKLAKSLPVAQFVENTYRLGYLSLATIVGEAGDLSIYSTPAKLWKRMGLAVINGERQRRVSGVDALTHGYAPQRRSAMWNIGSGIVGGMGKGRRLPVGAPIPEDWPYYQRLFVERLRFEAEKNPDMRREPVEKDGVLMESFSAHAAARAKRYCEKRLLRELWRAWRRAMDCATPENTLPAANLPSHGAKGTASPKRSPPHDALSDRAATEPETHNKALPRGPLFVEAAE